MIAAMSRPIVRTFFIRSPTTKPMTRGRSAAMMKVAERLGGRTGTKEECFAPLSYECIREDATGVRLDGEPPL